MGLPSRGLTWAVLVLGLALAGAGAALFPGGGDPPVEDAFTSSEMVALRFPDGWERAPVRGPESLLTLPKPEPAPTPAQPEGPTQPLTQMSTAEFRDALAALEWRRAARAPPNAMFNESQIASIKDRLALTAEQEKHWPPMEEALRAMAWRQTGGRGDPVVDPEAARRLKAAADSFLPRLSERQKRDIRLLANVAGLKLDF